MSTVAILNPRAGRGKSAETWRRVWKHLGEPVETLDTRGQGHAIDLAASAIKSGAKKIIAVGGDGTINEVVNGFFENEQLIGGEVALAIIPHGTGSDLRRILDLPLDEKKAAAVIRNGEQRMVDLLKVRYTTSEGRSALRYGINVTSFGAGGLVAARASRSSKPLGGKLAYIGSTLQTALSFPGNNVTLHLDETKTIEARVMNVVVGNGQYHGGGMWVCPGASIDDGLLDVTVIRHLTPWEVVKSLPRLYNGAIYSHPKVWAFRAKHIKADSGEPVAIEIDGEPLGRLPVEISILPKTLRLLMP